MFKLFHQEVLDVLSEHQGLLKLQLLGIVVQVSALRAAACIDQGPRPARTRVNDKLYWLRLRAELKLCLEESVDPELF